MRLTRRSSIGQVAAEVARAFAGARVHSVLTGGACAAVYSRGSYQSKDLDFILGPGARQSQLDEALTPIGFRRDADRYVHAQASFYIEFPRGPLAIGADYRIRPVVRAIRGQQVRMLSPTDSCRDRLAAFYHWSDRQSLQVAVWIALRHRVNLARIRRWSADEGFDEQFDVFRDALRRARARRRRRPV